MAVDREFVYIVLFLRECLLSPPSSAAAVASSFSSSSFSSSFFALGPVGAAGRERKNIENNDFERRGRSGQPAGSGRERKSIVFIKKVK